MNAYTVAEEMLGGMELTPGQVAQLRAIDHEYQQRLFALRHRPAAPGAPGGAEREPAPGELAELREMLESGIRGILTPEQHDLLDRR